MILKVLLGLKWNVSQLSKSQGRILFLYSCLLSNIPLCRGSFGCMLQLPQEQLQRLGVGQAERWKWSWNPQYSFPITSKLLNLAATHFSFEIFSFLSLIKQNFWVVFEHPVCFLKDLSLSSCSLNKKFSRILPLYLYFPPCVLVQQGQFFHIPKSINMRFKLVGWYRAPPVDSLASHQALKL